MLFPFSSNIRGFTLTEVLIAVIIVGIIGGIAMPSFQDSVYLARRGEAKAELLRMAQAEAKWRVNHTAYGDLIDIGGATPNQNYNFSITRVTTTSGPTFTLNATPTNTNGQINDVCGSLHVNQDLLLYSDNTSTCPKP